MAKLLNNTPHKLSVEYRGAKMVCVTTLNTQEIFQFEFSKKLQKAFEEELANGVEEYVQSKGHKLCPSDCQSQEDGECNLPIGSFQQCKSSIHISPFSGDAISKRGNEVMKEFNDIFKGGEYSEKLAIFCVRKIAELQLETESIFERLITQS